MPWNENTSRIGLNLFYYGSLTSKQTDKNVGVKQVILTTHPDSHRDLHFHSRPQ